MDTKLIKRRDGQSKKYTFEKDDVILTIDNDNYRLDLASADNNLLSAKIDYGIRKRQGKEWPMYMAQEG